MLKYTTLLLILGVSFLGAENVQDEQVSHQDLQKLENQREALELKLEACKLKKKIIEIQKFIEKDKLEKKERAEREAALIKLKSDLRKNRYNRRLLSAYAR